MTLGTLTLSNKSFAQENLVPNGSFEEYYTCPYQTWWVDSAYISSCKNWFSANDATPDYFNACSTDSDITGYKFSVPENYIGYQYAHSGNAYAGIIFNHDPIDPNYTWAEYIEVKLKNPLVANRQYELTFYISMAYWGTNSLGCYFSENKVKENDHELLPLTPHFQSDLNHFFCDSIGWTKVQYIYTADGGEEYITIGNFLSTPFAQTSNCSDSIIPYLDNYIYIDDVSLTSVEIRIPNVFTPNNDGTNDSFKIVGLPQNSKIDIFNRWGNIVFTSNQAEKEFWDGKYNGENVTDGVYFYIISNDTYKKSGFVQVFR